MEDWQDWQKLFQFGTIVIWPPDEIRAVVNAQRQVYDPVSQSYCEAHITVTQPFTRALRDAEWDQIMDMLKVFPAFEINYGPLNSFLPYPCIWYQIHPSQKILEIRTALHKTGFFNLALKHTEGFIPHMTITEGLSGPTVDQDLLERLQAESNQGTFLCDEIAYIVPDEHFDFKVANTLALS